MVDLIDATAVNPFDPTTYNAARDFSLEAVEAGYPSIVPMGPLEKMLAKVSTAVAKAGESAVYGAAVEPLRNAIAKAYETQILTVAGSLPENDPRRALIPSYKEDLRKIKEAKTIPQVRFFNAWMQYAGQLLHNPELAGMIKDETASAESYLGAVALTMFDYMKASRSEQALSPTFMADSLSENLGEVDAFRAYLLESSSDYQGLDAVVSHAKEYAKKALGAMKDAVVPPYGRPAPGTSMQPAQ